MIWCELVPNRHYFGKIYISDVKNDDCKHGRKHYDRAKVRQYMKEKREKEIANKKQKEHDEKSSKQKLKDRLMSLELKATHAASKVNLPII